MYKNEKCIYEYIHFCLYASQVPGSILGASNLWNDCGQLISVIVWYYILYNIEITIKKNKKNSKFQDKYILDNLALSFLITNWGISVKHGLPAQLCNLIASFLHDLRISVISAGCASCTLFLLYINDMLPLGNIHCYADDCF